MTTKGKHLMAIRKTLLFILALVLTAGLGFLISKMNMWLIVTLFVVGALAMYYFHVYHEYD